MAKGGYRLTLDRVLGLDQPPEWARRLRRILSKIQPEPDTGCWTWTGTGGEIGRPAIRLDARHQACARRVVWVLARGDVAAGRVVVVTCGNGSCVCPDHCVLARTPLASRWLRERQLEAQREEVKA